VYTKTGDGSVKRAGIGVALPAVSALAGRLGVEAGAAEHGSTGRVCSHAPGVGTPRMCTMRQLTKISSDWAAGEEQHG